VIPLPFVQNAKQDYGIKRELIKIKTPRSQGSLFVVGIERYNYQL
jgi:hypothetical protein